MSNSMSEWVMIHFMALGSTLLWYFWLTEGNRVNAIETIRPGWKPRTPWEKP